MTAELKELFGHELSTVVWAFIFALVFEIIDLRFLFSRRPMIVYHKPEEAFALLGRQQVRVQTLVLQNVGRAEAKDVHVIHNWPQDGFNADVRPLLQYSRYSLPGSQAAFKIDAIQPCETVCITYVYGTPPNQHPLFNSIRIADHLAHAVPFPLANRYPGWAAWLFKILGFIGAWVALYLLLKGLTAVWHALQVL